MFQSVIVLGRAGRDAEMRYTANGTPVLSWSLATGSGDNTLWFSCSLFGQQVEALSGRIRKGSMVLVSGYLSRPYVYQNRNGEHVAQMQVVAQSVRVLEPKGEEEETSEPASPELSFSIGEDEEEIPF